jgi:tRNA 5-methylaminomethyl-2-thiouridine biosynthesis bifunctional protein
MENTGAVSLQQADGCWSAVSAGKILADAECAVIAAGTASGSLAGLDWLPLRAIRGQTTTLPSTGQFSSLRAALCHKGYISPARLESHCIGATFDIEDMDTRTREADHRFNLDSLAKAVPGWEASLAALDERQLEGRVGYRCASPDYLPLIGPVPNHTLFLQNYASLRKNARQTILSNGDYMRGLYLSTGHGSRGLTSTALAAEVIASLVCGEPIPLSRELYRAVSPGRFIIRDLARKQA